MKKDYDGMYAVRMGYNPSIVNTDFERYTKYVTSLEKQIDPDTVDAGLLAGFLGVAVASGDLLDLYKKQIVYGQPGLKQRMLEANTKLRQADIVLDDAIVTSHMMAPTKLKHPINLRLLHAAIGLFGEAAEILRAIQLQAQTGVIDQANVTEELGDVAYYFAAAHDSMGLTPYFTMGRNSAKLDVRFGGAFSLEKVTNRDLGAEREALEGVTQVPAPYGVTLNTCFVPKGL